MPLKRILVFTYGTRGDVEPFLALAKGLQQAGHDVRFATSSRFRGFVEEFGVSFFPMSDTSLAAIESPDGKVMLEGSSGLYQRIRAGIRLARKSGPINDTLMQETWEAAADFQPDIIVFSSKMFGAPHVAEKLKVPAVFGTLQPMIVPTKSFPAMGLPRLPFPGYNRLSYSLVTKSFGMMRKGVNRFRKNTLDLAPVRSNRDVLLPPGAGTIPLLHAYSESVVPRPNDWPETAVVTGYWRLEKDTRYAPFPELQSFLDDGPPPVFIGFGSMTSADPKVLGDLATGALRKAGQRGVIAKGWAELEVAADDNIIAIPPVPYDWLFPRMAAIVHHGGAGTTSEGFYAGVPCVICPFFGDQPGWAQLSVRLGVGAGPVPRKRLTEDRLARAINDATSSPRLRDTAKALAARLREEDGVARAVEIITQM